MEPFTARVMCWPPSSSQPLAPPDRREMLKLYDEKVWRQNEFKVGEVEAFQQFCLRVRLFRLTAKDGTYTVETWPVYLLVEQMETYDPVGEELVSGRYPQRYQKLRTYVTGNDSSRIRQAIAVIDAFGG